MTQASPGRELERFVASAGVFAHEAWLRAAAAGLALGAAALALLGALPLPAFLLALTGALVGLGWIFAARRGIRRAASPERFTLVIHEHAFVLGEGPQSTVIPFADVSDVHVDEQRLDVVISRTGNPEVRIEPRYPGVEIHALMDRLRNAWAREHDCLHGGQGVPGRMWV